MKYDVIIVGGGIAGLTAAAYLSRAGRSVLLCEKEDSCGGLVNSFERNGFIFDGGIRAMEDAGALFPMLKQLGVNIPFVRNKLSIGLGERVIYLNQDEDVLRYRDLLNEFYPESRAEIDAIITEVQKIMRYVEVQYGIKNPAFLDVKEDRDYFIKVILPWMVKYAITVPKIKKAQVPVVEFLRSYTANQSLLDIITQHFFQQTPAYFALSYFRLYLDYHYPLGGTGKLIQKLVELIESQGGIIRTNSNITTLDAEKKIIRDTSGETYGYKSLIWAADQKALYQRLDITGIQDHEVREAVNTRRAFIANKVGNDSVLTVFLSVDLDKSYFEQICSEHFFYTLVPDGQSKAGPLPIGKDRETVENWLEKFLALTTYEISIPVLRDETMAPEGKTGLIVSILFDYQLTKETQDAGWYNDFKALCEQRIIDLLDQSIYPGIKDKLIESFSSTPLTLARHAGTTDGAIVGWSFRNEPLPAENRIPKILNAIRTPIPGVVQAGQWTYSPAGLPTSLITGKLAADQVLKDLKKL